MGNCLWGVRSSRRVRIREQQRKVERKRYQQELENEKYREDELVAQRRLVELVDDPENAAEVAATAAQVAEAQDKQDLGEEKLEFMRAINERVDAAAAQDEMRTMVTNAASVVFRVREVQPPVPQVARGILAAPPPRRAALPVVPRGHIVVHRQDSIIEAAKRTRRGLREGASRSPEDEELRERFERLKNDED